jgi:hypothetical protein
MKKTIKFTLLSSILAIAFISSAAISGVNDIKANVPDASNFKFSGYGGWRDNNGKNGPYKSYKNVQWTECRLKCLNQKSCLGVEFGMQTNGGTTCEIHTGPLGEIVKGSGQATVWTNYAIAK